MIDNTVTLTDAKARKKVRAGVLAVYEPSRRTLGPEGKNALLPRTWNRGPRITNDGITVIELARQLKDPHERLAAEAFAEGSKRTNELAGDGTTATSVLGANLYFNVMDSLPDADLPTVGTTANGTRALRREIKEAKDLVIAEIKKRSIPITTKEQLEQIAVISIGKEDTEAAHQVAELVWDIGRDEEGNFVDNHIDVVEGHKGEIEIEKVEGMRFPSKIASRVFINRPERFEMVADDVAVLVTNYTIDNAVELIQLLDKCCVKHGISKLAIFAPKFSPFVLNSLAESYKKGFFTYPILCPSLRTDDLEDLAAFTGAVLIDKDQRKLSNVSHADLGGAGKIVVKDTEAKDDAILIDGKGEKTDRVKERKETLKGQLVEAKVDIARMKLERRIANLSAAIGVVRVGASTNAELLYLKLKIEDGVNACKAALQEGFVPGGGTCLKDIAESLPTNILTEALKSPYRQIQENAGGNLVIGDDVIDPTKVIRLEVEHAASITSSLISADVIIAEVPDGSPYDGYESIAHAIRRNTYYTAKHQGMLKESEDEAEKDRMARFEEAELMDKD